MTGPSTIRVTITLIMPEASTGSHCLRSITTANGMHSAKAKKPFVRKRLIKTPVMVNMGSTGQMDSRCGID